MTAGDTAGTGGPVIRGSIRAVRTFRLMPDGALAPITRPEPWTDGTNTATCNRRPRGPGPAPAHPAPATGCRCGLWGYGNLQALRESALREQARVVAVISCHGTVVPGTLGVRAQHASIDAVWLSPDVAEPTRRLVAARYPNTALYRALPAMLAEHPPTVLPGYRLPAQPRAAAVHAGLAVTAAWWLLMLIWALTAAAPELPAGASLGGVDVGVLIAPMAIAFVTALVVLTRPRRWPVGLLAVLLQSALVAAGQLWLQPYVALRQVTALAGAAGTLHVAVAARAWWLRLRLDARGATAPTGRWRILPL